MTARRWFTFFAAGAATVLEPLEPPDPMNPTPSPLPPRDRITE